MGLALLSWVDRASVISASSSTGVKAVGSARPCRSLAASRRRGIILCGLTLSHISKVFPLLRVLIRLRRRGVSILRLITFWLDVGHVDLPEWLQETKRQGSRPFLRLRYTKSLNRLRELTDDPRPATRKRGLLGRLYRSYHGVRQVAAPPSRFRGERSRHPPVRRDRSRLFCLFTPPTKRDLAGRLIQAASPSASILVVLVALGGSCAQAGSSGGRSGASAGGGVASSRAIWRFISAISRLWSR